MKSKLISKKLKINYLFLFTTIWGSCLLGKTNNMQIALSKTRAGGERKRSHRIGRDDVGPIINVSQIQAGATSVVYRENNT